MTDDAVPEELGEPVQISAGRSWKVGEMRPGQAEMDWRPDSKDDESDDQ